VFQRDPFQFALGVSFDDERNGRRGAFIQFHQQDKGYAVARHFVNLQPAHFVLIGDDHFQHPGKGLRGPRGIRGHQTHRVVVVGTRVLVFAVLWLEADLAACRVQDEAVSVVGGSRWLQPPRHYTRRSVT